MNCHCLQISDNGIIGLDYHYDAYTSLPLPLNTSNKIIAPYWADVDTGGTGTIFYRQTSDFNLLTKASYEIRQSGMSQNVVVTNLVIATWYKVGYYDEKIDKVCTYDNVCNYVCRQLKSWYTYKHRYIYKIYHVM